jgi:hypothetical protein
MDVIILADNPDNKGTQLEKLTAAILKNLSYGNITVNEIGSGGNEIDVTAEFIQPGITAPVKRLMICECKAHKAPISTSDWMKFLGKVFTNELGGKSVDGCFIALNGANGNVKGQYRALREKRDTIHLISGDELFNVFIELFGLLKPDDILNIVGKLTQRNVLNNTVCYYEDTLYWLITFTDNHYTLLSATGKILSGQDSLALQALVSKNVDSLGFIDLQEENEVRARVLFTEKYIMSMFLLKGKKMTDLEILEQCNGKHGRYPVNTFEKTDIDTALFKLIEKEVVVPTGKSYQLKVFAKKYNAKNVIDLYYHLLNEMIILIPLGSPFYCKYINEDLLNAVAEIQGKLPIPENRKADWIKILQWSPSALGYAINPDPFLLEHRDKFPLGELLDSNDIAYFNQKLSMMFAKDFSTQALFDYFHNVCGIVELETEQIMRIKSNKMMTAQIDFKERLRLGNFVHEENQQIIAVRILPDVKEPWEEPWIKPEEK